MNISRSFYIEEFLDWLVEIERFFESGCIAEKKQVKFVESKLNGKAWTWWEQLQRMRTWLGKAPIQNWIKMKKYLKRKFLPPDYRDLMFQEFLNCKQLGNSVAVYTKEFYRLQSYIDLNESEAYNISRYKMGLRWLIKKRLCVQSFHSLADLILAAKGIEQLIEREENSKWRPQTLQGNNKYHVADLAVSEAQNSYSKENALTPSLKVSADQNGYGSNIPPSRRMTENFAHGSKNEDDVSMERTEEQPRHHSVFCTGSTIKGNICLLSSDEKASDNTVSYRQVTTLELRNDKFLEPCNINWTPGVQNQQKVTKKCESQVSFREIYFDRVFHNVFDMTLNYPPLGRAWESYDDTNFWVKNIAYYVYVTHRKFLQKPLIDNNSEGQEKQEVIINDGREHGSCLMKKGIIFMVKKEEGYTANSAALIPRLLQGLIIKFPGTEEILKMPTSLSKDQHEMDVILGSGFGNVSHFSTEQTQILQDKLMDLLGMTQITEKISPIAVLVLLVPENFQSWKMYIENQTMRMTCMSGIPYKYIMDILCRSSKNMKMNLSRCYNTSSIEKRHHRQLITTLKSNLNKLREVDLRKNGFIRVNPNKWIHIMQVSESESSKHAIFLSNNNDKNWMMITLRSKIILSNVDHQIRMQKRSEFPAAAKPITTTYNMQVIPRKCTSLPNIILLLDWTSKRYNTSDKYCFMTSHVVFPKYMVNHEYVTDDKGKIKTIIDMKAFRSIYQVDRNYGLASFYRRHIKNLGSNAAKTGKCIHRENYIYTIKREIKRWKMKNNHCTALQLWQNFIKYVRIYGHLSTVWVRGCQARQHNIIQIQKSCKEREKKS